MRTGGPSEYWTVLLVGGFTVHFMEGNEMYLGIVNIPFFLTPFLSICLNRSFSMNQRILQHKFTYLLTLSVRLLRGLGIYCFSIELSTIILCQRFLLVL